MNRLNSMVAASLAALGIGGPGSRSYAGFAFTLGGSYADKVSKGRTESGIAHTAKTFEKACRISDQGRHSCPRDTQSGVRIVKRQGKL